MGVSVQADSIEFRDLSRINVLLGKNGCGKSRALKEFELSVKEGRCPGWEHVGYISPERGGFLTLEPNVEYQISSNRDWLTTSRRANQMGQFKHQTIAQFRQLLGRVQAQMEYDLEAGVPQKSFRANQLVKINSLLDNIKLDYPGENTPFVLRRKNDNVEVSPQEISSGESELISLAIEALNFTYQLGSSRGLLLIDEPDVHIHPDLQARLMEFLANLVDSNNLDVLLCTHSTALLGPLKDRSDSSVCLMKSGDKTLAFEPIDDAYIDLLPVFGAHPLTQIYSNSPILLVEGEDEIRVWQSAIRSAQGKLKLFPVECGGLPEMPRYEKRARKLLQSVYGEAPGYSLRDGDERVEQIVDEPPLIRLQLSCRESENLMLCDEALVKCGTSWEECSGRLTEWIEENEGHEKYADVKMFVDQGLDRKNFKLKEFRNILLADVLNTKKPWEVLVGQTIADLTRAAPRSESEGSVSNYLGSRTVEKLVGE